MRRFGRHRDMVLAHALLWGYLVSVRSCPVLCSRLSWVVDFVFCCLMFVVVVSN